MYTLKHRLSRFCKKY